MRIHTCRKKNPGNIFLQKGSLFLVCYLSEFTDWRYTVSHVGIFDAALWTVAPLTFSLLQLSPPPPHPPSLCQSIVYTVQTMCGWWGVGVLSPVGDHILQEFNTLYLTRFRITKLLDHLRQINTCRKVPLQVKFFRLWHFALVHG